MLQGADTKISAVIGCETIYVIAALPIATHSADRYSLRRHILVLTCNVENYEIENGLRVVSCFSPPCLTEVDPLPL